MCVCAWLLMLDIFFSKAHIKPVLYLCLRKKTQKDKHSVYSTRASPLLVHSCFMLKDHAALKKGFCKSHLQSRDQQCGEETLEIKRKTSGCQKGCAPGLKALGKPCRWSADTGGLRAIVPSLRGCKPALRKGFFQKPALFPAKSTSFCKQHPCRHTAPSCFCTGNPTFSH